MALVDEVISRYSAQILIEITNPQLAAAASRDDTRLANAGADVEGNFKILGITYDNDDDRHVTVAVEGVFVRLQVIAGNFPIGAWNEWKNTLRDLSLVTSRNRITPATNSNMSPTAEELGTKPFADLSRQKRFRGRGPSGDVNTFE